MKIFLKYIIKTNPINLVLLVSFLLGSVSLTAENLKKVVELEGTWKFTIGDDPSWADVNYNDKEWDFVFVPRYWESSGFIDYNGYAWYRKEFQINNLDEESLFLMMGYIDDVDEVYLNGELIGSSGIFPPLVGTAYNQPRKYIIPDNLLNRQGKNVIAVRVYDEYLEGGIYKGPVGIYYDEDTDFLSLNLAGYWDFETVTNFKKEGKEIYNQPEGKIYVPGFWEVNGYSGLDGSTVYSTSFMLPDRFDENNIMIVLGYIDDIDKVYINDIKIGTVTDLRTGKDRDTPEHIILRGYTIPKGVLNRGGSNAIVVKVYDTGGLGGIYEGPIGLITADNFELLKKKQVEKPKNMWDYFFKSFLD